MTTIDPTRLLSRSVPFSPPNITDEEIAEVVDSLRSDWITTGPKTKKFEEEFAARVQAPAAPALRRCAPVGRPGRSSRQCLGAERVQQVRAGHSERLLPSRFGREVFVEVARDHGLLLATRAVAGLALQLPPGNCC